MASDHPTLTDDAARRKAITVHDRTFLVEAGAGSGKTAVLAGRIAMMLAAGIAPKHIAAVTFTELAASELLIRVRQFAGALLADEIPNELRIALPEGLSSAQRDHLQLASETLDEITCSTIHGFCQHLIKPYPVAADIDPGAAIMDRDQSDMTFDEVVDTWLRAELDQEDESLLGDLVWKDRDETLKLIRTILKHLRKHRELRVATPADFPPLVRAACQETDRFSEFLRSLGAEEPETAALASGLAQLARHAHGDRHGDRHADFSYFLRFLVAERDAGLFTQSGTFRVYRNKTKWANAAAAAGFSRAEGGRWSDTAKDLYDACCEAWTEVFRTATSQVLAGVLEAVRPALDAYRDYKRSTAQLDFDDLIYSARELLRENEDVRKALGKRYWHLLVDEFQDTDPMQTEIFWRLCGDPADEAPDADWSGFQIRPGALFLVGDPKQAIYRFRGADVAAYMRARDALIAQDPETLLHISTNFRSRAPILEYVNERFEAPLSASEGQPGFTALDAFHEAPEGWPCVATLDVEVEPDEHGKTPVEAQRDAEAKAVAELCARLIGSEYLAESDGQPKVCKPGDIALLAPSGTDLWRYEETLELLEIPVATQAGKGLYRRQEIQDLIALTRMLADRRDTLALGALLRGPLVGLTEEELLDIVWALPRKENGADEGSLPRIHLDVDTESIKNADAREVFEKLQSLARMANSTTPHDLLSQAINQLGIRPILVQRHHGQAERVLANVDLFLTMSRAYSVRGLRAFAEAMTTAWSDETRAPEGRPDAQEESVALFTMHAAKGLEWPIVIPVNTMTGIRSVDPDITDGDTGCLYCKAFGAEPEGYEEAKEAEQNELNREHVRLWYVATTRAKELLVLPSLSVKATDKAWIKVLDLGLPHLPDLDVGELSMDLPPPPDEVVNAQTRELFADEAKTIVDARQLVRWQAPSRDEDSTEGVMRSEEWEAVFSDGDDGTTEEAEAITVRGGRERGSIIHKLFEEVLTGETAEVEADLVARADVLIRQMGKEVVDDPAQGLAPKELAACVLRGLSIPEVAELRPRLVPEFNVYGSSAVEAGEDAVSGAADAIAIGENGNPEVVIDWKTDVAPDERTLDHYSEQVGKYLELTEAQRGLIVLVTSARILRITRERR